MIFGSREWTAEAARVLPELVLRFGPVQAGSFTISERFEDIPPLGETVVWSARFSPAGVDVAAEDLPDADFYLRGSYDVLLPLGRTLIGGDPEARLRYNALRQQIADGGTITFRGDLSRAPVPVAQILSEFHDHMAKITD